MDGKRLGNAKVWSPGAYPIRVDGKRPVIHVVLRLRNDGDTPITVDVARANCEITGEGRDFINLGPPVRVDGTATAAPASVGRIDLYYGLPGGWSPLDVQGFELNWAVQTSAGLYSQSTPFVQHHERAETVTYVYWTPWWAYPAYPGIY